MRELFILQRFQMLAQEGRRKEEEGRVFVEFSDAENKTENVSESHCRRRNFKTFIKRQKAF